VREIQALLEKANRALESAEAEVRAGNLDFAASRAYYASFYVAQALLIEKGYRFSNHGKVIGQYGLIFAKSEALDPRFHKLLLKAFRLRQVGDYAALAQLESEPVLELIQGGRDFLEAASRYLERLPEGAEGGESGED